MEAMNSKPFIDFEQKHIMVTGATSGIGHAISLELSRQNARVILLGVMKNGWPKQ